MNEVAQLLQSHGRLQEPDIARRIEVVSAKGSRLTRSSMHTDQSLLSKKDLQ